MIGNKGVAGIPCGLRRQSLLETGHVEPGQPSPLDGRLCRHFGSNPVVLPFKGIARQRCCRRKFLPQTGQWRHIALHIRIAQYLEGLEQFGSAISPARMHEVFQQARLNLLFLEVLRHRRDGKSTVRNRLECTDQIVTSRANDGSPMRQMLPSQRQGSGHRGESVILRLQGLCQVVCLSADSRVSHS